MKKLTLLQETNNNTIDINGHVFEIMISDDEVFTLPMEFSNELKKMDAEHPETVDAAVRYVNSLYDRVLGAGSLAVISGGKPVSIVKKIEWFRQIFSAIAEVYFDALERKYE